MQAVGKRRSALVEITNVVSREPKKQRNDFYTVTRGVEETSDKMKKRSAKAKKAAQARVFKFTPPAAAPVRQSSVVDDIIYATPIMSASLGKGMSAKRRAAIEFVFSHIMGSPHPDVWQRDGVVVSLMKQFNVSQGSSKEVKKVLYDSLKATTEKPYDPSAGKKKGGRRAHIQDLTPQAGVVYKSLEQGLSTTQTTVIVNEWRRAQTPPLPPISWSCVEKFILRSGVTHRSRRVYKKSGKEDVGSIWARARLAQCLQFKKQLRLGKLDPNSDEVKTSIALGLLPLHELGIAWWDENHKKVILGHTSKYEVRLSKNPYDNEPTPVQFGGVVPAKSMRTSVKFAGEARGCFGAAMVEDAATGVVSGVKALPFDYTGKWVVGVKAWREQKEAELRRVLPLKGGWTLDPTYGYKQKYGDRWEEVVEAVLGRDGAHGSAKVCITALMDHVILESTAMHAGSTHAEDFMIFHDGLSQWWEKEAQDYMEVRGFKHRQLRCVGETNKDNRYAGRVVGDSPEMCRALDAHGFADLKLSMCYHTSLSSRYAFKDPRRFGMGVPKEVWRTMCRCWHMEPTSARIVEDITAFERVLDVLIAAEGCVVRDEFLRTGRRARRSDGTGDCVNKPRASQRIETLYGRPCHPDCEEALRMLTTPGARTDLELAAEELGALMDETSDEEDEVDRELRLADMASDED